MPEAAEPPWYVEPTEAIFQNTLAKYPIQETLQSSFLKEARFRTPHTFVEIQEKEGRSADDDVGNQKVNAVLELSVQRLRLKRVEGSEEGINPPMALSLVVRTRLIRGTEKTIWYDEIFVHQTESRLYTLWPYPTFIQEEIEKAFKKLAKEMVEKLFHQKPPEQPSTPATSDTSAFSPLHHNESNFDYSAVHRASG